MKRLLVLVPLLLLGAAAPLELLRSTVPSAAMPNMGVPDGGVPDPGVTPGPSWASKLNAILQVIDQHDHSPGHGVQVPAAGLNIQSALPMNGQPLDQVGNVVFSGGTNPTALLLQSDGLDLTFVDGHGLGIPITCDGAVCVGASRGINGQYSTDPAHPSAYYTTSSLRYTLTTNGSTRAALAFGATFAGSSNVSINTTIADTDGITILNVSSVGAARTITLPLAGNNTGRVLVVKDYGGSAGTNNITVQRQSSDTIDGVSTTKVINTAYGSLRFESAGTAGWFTW